MINRARAFACLLAVLLAPVSAGAQYWSFDARTIALGGVGSGSGNIATTLIDEQRPYRSIVIPLGLLQVLGDLDTFDPDSDAFDPVRATEYAVSPIHFVIGRDGTNTQNLFVTSLLNGNLSRDLNEYAGFVPARELTAEGLANPSWGKTFRLRENGGAFQGVYVGAGPYLSMQTRAVVDDRLRSILDSDVPVYIANTSFPLSNTTTGQIALAVTGGYRARFLLPAGTGSGSALDGFYVAANYNYLRGFRYESFDAVLRLDTDAAGLLTFRPALPTPFDIVRDSSTSGNGFSIDLGTGIVIAPWQFGFGVNGLANRIEWTDAERTRYQLDALFAGTGDFRETTVPVLETVRVELPEDYRAYAAYNTATWGATAEWANGFQGTTFRAGVERKFERFDLRGGGRFVRDRWEPSGGFGFNFSDRVGLDVAAFGTSANAERQRDLALAVSIRLMQSTGLEP